MYERFKRFFLSPGFLVVTLSLCLTITISTVVGIGGYSIINSFWGPFFIAFGCQFVLFFIVNTILQNRDDVVTAKIATDQLNALSKYFINLSCAYCSKSNTLPIVLNQENRFKCESCQQVNGVKMQFFSTQITVPLEKITLPDGVEYSVKG